MKNLFRKTVCLLSGAVLFCGAGGMTAYADGRTSTSSRPSYNSSVSTRPSSSTNALSLAFELNSYNFTIKNGGSATIRVTKAASCSLPKDATVSYQWVKEPWMISGATSSSYKATEEGEYFCMVTVTYTPSATRRNPSPGPVSQCYSTAHAVVNYEPLKVTAQPKGGTLDSYDNYTLSVEATGGSAPYKYEWHEVPGYRGQDSPVLGTTRTFTAHDEGTYYCKITDSKGRYVWSSSAKVQPGTFRITSLPRACCIYSSGESKTLAINAYGGKKPYRYEWHHDSYIMPDRTNSIKVNEAGRYYCVVYDANNNKLTSNTSNVYRDVLRFTKNTSSVGSNDYDDVATLSVEVTGAISNYSYEWQKYVNDQWVSANCYRPTIYVNRSDAHAYSWRNNEMYGGRSDLHYLIHYSTKFRCIVRSYNSYGNAVAEIISNEASVCDNVKDHITDVEFYW